MASMLLVYYMSLFRENGRIRGQILLKGGGALFSFSKREAWNIAISNRVSYFSDNNWCLNTLTCFNSAKPNFDSAFFSFSKCEAWNIAISNRVSNTIVARFILLQNKYVGIAYFSDNNCYRKKSVGHRKKSVGCDLAMWNGEDERSAKSLLFTAWILTGLSQNPSLLMQNLWVVDHAQILCIISAILL
ncbi:hypothetical protein ACJX0J_009720, partial [Zea mays]